jgi:hypothetical protein
MKKLFLLSVIFYSLNASAGILLTPNTNQIYLDGDSAVTFSKLYLVEKVIYDGADSSASVTFTAYKKEGGKLFGVTDVPVQTQYYKIPAEETNIIKYCLQQAKNYFTNLGYTAQIK